MRNMDFCREIEKNNQQSVGRITKSYIFASPFEKMGKTADVAQLARARDL